MQYYLGKNTQVKLYNNHIFNNLHITPLILFRRAEDVGEFLHLGVCHSVRLKAHTPCRDIDLRRFVQHIHLVESIHDIHIHGKDTVLFPHHHVVAFVNGPEEVARQLCMGYSNFRRIFKEYTGLSPAKYIQQVRMGKVKEALTNSIRPVKEIAFEMGYENQDYFFTAFRRLTGMTPQEYRAFTQGK